ncbi:MAG TPA: translocation/assembly module TamB domain-containing protein, partial [Ferruginibacter sp.]|nr:translocation/assembly module TamB domain-containing protein [Ferruginibacter sp.]
NESFLSGDNTLGIAANTIGQILSNALTTTFSKFLQKALNDNTISTYFDVNPTLDLKQSVSQLQGAAKFGITKSYLNGKVIISLGGNLDYNNPYLTNTSLLLTPDFTAEWLLSKDGKLRIVGFRRTNIDYTLGQRNRQGISLTYKSDFDRFSDLFGPSEEKRKKRLDAKLHDDNNLPSQ